MNYTATLYLNRINRLVSVAETQHVSCEVRIEFIYVYYLEDIQSLEVADCSITWRDAVESGIWIASSGLKTMSEYFSEHWNLSNTQQKVTFQEIKTINFI
jgi:hypothetical protein